MEPIILSENQTYQVNGMMYPFVELLRALQRDAKEQERNRKKGNAYYQRKKANLPVKPEPSDLPVKPEPSDLPVKDLGNGSQSINGLITMWNGRPWVPIAIP